MLALEERDAELGVLRERLRQARDGAGSLVLVEAPAGTGKTALLRRLRADARGPARAHDARRARALAELVAPPVPDPDDLAALLSAADVSLLPRGWRAGLPPVHARS